MHISSRLNACPSPTKKSLPSASTASDAASGESTFIDRGVHGGGAYFQTLTYKSLVRSYELIDHHGINSLVDGAENASKLNENL